MATFSTCICPMGTEGAQFAAFVIEFYLPESTAGIQDTKVGSSTDLGYHIIYGSHIVWGALDGFVEITGSRHRRIVPLGFVVTTVELTHGVYSSCIGSRMPACISRSSSSW